MPKLAIIDHVVSGAGVERFLQGLVGGLLALPDISRWDITVSLARRNSGGHTVKWPDHLTAPNLHFHHLREEFPARLIDSVLAQRRMFGIPGTARARSAIASMIRGHGTSTLRRYAGDNRL